MKNKHYLSPQAEVLEIELEGILCQSTGVGGSDLVDGTDDLFNPLNQ